MPEVRKVYKESLPALRLIGKRYTEADRAANGSYSHNWREWNAQKMFVQLEDMTGCPPYDDSYIGFMRMEKGFEYWIGMFFSLDTPVPDGYESLDLSACDAAVCWIYGKEDTGELYGMAAHDLCMKEFSDRGWKVTEESFFVERYNRSRFDAPDEQGNVILDYMASLP